MEIVSLLGAILDRTAFEQDVDWDYDCDTINITAYRTERNAYKNVLNNKVKYANSQNVNDIIVKLDSIINSISDVKIQNELRDVQNQIRELVK